MPTLTLIDLYGDPHCPYAYLTAYRLWQWHGEWRGKMAVEGSQTFVLPSGEQKSYLGLLKLKLDKEQHYRAVLREDAPCEGAECLDLLREMVDGVARGLRSGPGKGRCTASHPTRSLHGAVTRARRVTAH